MTRSKAIYELYFISGGYRAFFLGAYSKLAAAKKACKLGHNKERRWRRTGDSSIMDLGQNDSYLIKRYKRYEVEYE